MLVVLIVQGLNSWLLIDIFYMHSMSVMMQCYIIHECDDAILCEHPQIEVIGGAEKYMAVCRTCYGLPGHHHLSPTATTPIRGGDITVGRQLFPDEPVV